ncbi:hypothetical protein EJB05_55605, partial [Eragrostis curvula]
MNPAAALTAPRAQVRAALTAPRAPVRRRAHGPALPGPARAHQSCDGRARSTADRGGSTGVRARSASGGILEKAAVGNRGRKRRQRLSPDQPATSEESSTARSTARSGWRPAQLVMDPNQFNDGSQGGFPGGS